MIQKAEKFIMLMKSLEFLLKIGLTSVIGCIIIFNYSEFLVLYRYNQDYKIRRLKTTTE